MSDCIHSTPIGDGLAYANLCNELLAEFLHTDPGAADAFVSEFGSLEDGQDVPADSPEGIALFDATTAVLCRFYGIPDVNAFRAYLRRRGGVRLNHDNTAAGSGFNRFRSRLLAAAGKNRAGHASRAVGGDQSVFGRSLMSS